MILQIIERACAENREKYNANIKMAEIPPGPPVLSTLVAEVYGPNQTDRINVAKSIKDIFLKTDGVVDVDWFVEDNMVEYEFIFDKEKAALNGVSEEMFSKTIYALLNGIKTGIIHNNTRETVDIVVKLPEKNGIILI